MAKYLLSLLFTIGQKVPAQKAKTNTTEYRSILVSANGRFYGVVEVQHV